MARRALLINPRIGDAALAASTKTLAESVRIMHRKAAAPPLGLMTVASLLPPDWRISLVDRNIRPVSETEWASADIVMVTGYNDQAADQAAVLGEARRRGKLTIAGGAWASIVPEQLRTAGADFVVVEEAELGLPLLLEALDRGEREGIIRSCGSADLATLPTPRFDLVDMANYALATVQFSRGCPFKCEFCDILAMGIGGPVMRHKTPAQFLAELDALYASGWRGAVFIADDNFIGDRKRVRELLPEMTIWMARHDYPFTLMTEASINLALDRKLVADMVESGITRLFVGIETVDQDALEITRKRQNFGMPPDEACRRLARAGMEVYASLVLGFDGETSGAGARLLRLVEEAPITLVDLLYLVALPRAELWTRLEREGRLRTGARLRPWGPDQLNFETTRPVSDIISEGLAFIRQAYSPAGMLERCWRQHRDLAQARRHQAPLTAGDFLSFAHVISRYGLWRDCRITFWRALADLSWRGGLVSFLRVLVHGETHLGAGPSIIANWQAGLAVEDHYPASAAAE